ncbi:MAG: GntR family transcriptional regulator [Burkholderiales bacterium]|nr:GntR family transcriptional regulator [Burkholderiales bacterium]
MINEEQLAALLADLEPEESQAQMAYRVLEEMIVTLQLPPGSKISEKSLHRSLGIGRTPLREALQRLAIEGTVKILPRAGVIVSDIDLADQFKLIEVRRELEKILAGRAARLASPEEKQHFRDLAGAFEAAGQKDDESIFIHADREFNALTLKAARNNYATCAIGPIAAQTRRFWFLHFKRFGNLARVSRLHMAIARAIAVGDESDARAASDRLIDYVEEYTQQTLQSML